LDAGIDEAHNPGEGTMAIFQREVMNRLVVRSPGATSSGRTGPWTAAT